VPNVIKKKFIIKSVMDTFHSEHEKIETPLSPALHGYFISEQSAADAINREIYNEPVFVDYLIIPIYLRVVE
jgi:hypothetical protein